jgi:SAM-dependent methyltransferase
VAHLQRGPSPRLRAFDLVVVTSFTERLGRSAVEAKHAGLPVVASGVGGLVEVVEDRSSGWLVPPDDPEALDIACDQGHTLELLRETGIGATGVQLDAALCAVCRSKGLEVVQADCFAHLRWLPRGSLDSALASHIVEHFAPSQIREIFELIARAMRPEGRLVIITPNIENLRRAVGDFWRDPTHVRPYPAPALERLLRPAGWHGVESTTHSKRKLSRWRRLVFTVRNWLIGHY